MRYIVGLILILTLSGCAVTGATILAYSAGAITVAANAAEVAKVVKDTKDYLLDNNTTED